MTRKSRVVVFDLDDTLYKEQDYLLSAYREIANRIEGGEGVLPVVGDRFDGVSSLGRVVGERSDGVSGLGRMVGEESDGGSIVERMVGWWHDGENVFARLIDTYHLRVSVDDLLGIYRAHRPEISLDAGTKRLLDRLSRDAVIGIITDGRSITQRHKVEALGLSAYVADDDILISGETGYEKPAEEPFRHVMARYPASVYYYIGDNPAKDFEAPNRLGWTTVCLLDDGRNVHPQSFRLPEPLLPHHRIAELAEIENIIYNGK